jgi:hypothetical protein
LWLTGIFDHGQAAASMGRDTPPRLLFSLSRLRGEGKETSSSLGLDALCIDERRPILDLAFELVA